MISSICDYTNVDVRTCVTLLRNYFYFESSFHQIVSSLFWIFLVYTVFVLIMMNSWDVLTSFNPTDVRITVSTIICKSFQAFFQPFLTLTKGHFIKKCFRV